MSRKYDDALWHDLGQEVGLWAPAPGRETELVEMLVDDGVPRRHAEIVVCLAADHGANEIRKTLLKGMKTGAEMLFRRVFG